MLRGSSLVVREVQGQRGCKSTDSMRLGMLYEIAGWRDGDVVCHINSKDCTLYFINM